MGKLKDEAQAQALTETLEGKEAVNGLEQDRADNLDVKSDNVLEKGRADKYIYACKDAETPGLEEAQADECILYPSVGELDKSSRRHGNRSLHVSAELMPTKEAETSGLEEAHAGNAETPAGLEEAHADNAETPGLEEAQADECILYPPVGELDKSSRRHGNRSLHVSAELKSTEQMASHQSTEDHTNNKNTQAMALMIQRLLDKQQSFTEQVCEPAAIAQTMALRIKLNAEFFQVKEDLHILRDTVSEKEVRQYLYAAVEDDPRYADFITEQSNDNTSYVDKCRFKHQAPDGMVVAPPTVTVIEMSVTMTIIQMEILKVAMP
jgi:hypothetical protein